MSKLEVRELSESPMAGWWFEMMGEGDGAESDDDTLTPVSLWEAEIAALTEDQLLAFTEAGEDD
jgi:hypothetical protein